MSFYFFFSSFLFVLLFVGSLTFKSFQAVCFWVFITESLILY